MNFTAIDFETANWFRKSACSVGLIKVENGIIVDEFYSLIKPTPFWFHPINKNIHGLDEPDCIDAPTFDQLWPKIEHWLNDQIVVAHNVSFDKSVLLHLIDHYKLNADIKDYLCTLYMSRVEMHELDKHKLPYVYYKLFDKQMEEHHDALADAKASAEIAIEIANRWSPNSFEKMTAAMYSESVNKRVGSKRKFKVSELVPDKGYESNYELRGTSFVFTGELNSFTQEEAAQYVINHGGIVSAGVTKSTTHLIVGTYHPKYGQDYKSGKVKKAEDKILNGQNIEIMTQKEFLDITRPMH